MDDPTITNHPEEAPVEKLVFIDPGSHFEIRALPAHDESKAAAILASATGAGTPEAATAVIAELREAADAAIYGAYVDRALVGSYGIRRDGMANTIALIAVDPDHRKRGIGRAMLTDALRRSGKRPLTAETDEEGLPFYKACGFKLVGRRVHPSGTVRYRIGWHAPGLRFKGGSTNALTSQPITPSPSTTTGKDVPS
ncbi:MAG: GNAT family N-acetyltransferase [Thermomicrobiales bacterium]